jgi:RNA polymerase II-associated factor 1
METRVVSEANPSSGPILISLFTAIQAPAHPPVPHPHDRALLRPLSTLGKPKFSDSGVSFLRRTEYISSYTSKSRFESTTSRSLIKNTGSRKERSRIDVDKESPEYIRGEVENSFQIAAQNLDPKNRNLVRHPSKRNLKLLDAYPLLPDLDAFPDAGGYVTVKFLTNPVPPSSTYDTRLEGSLLKPIEVTEEEQNAQQLARENYERDPDRFPAPDDTIEYEFFMTETPAEAANFKRKFDVLDLENDDDELYTQKNASGEPCFRFKRIRPYESASFSGSVPDKYEEEVIIALHDGSDGLHQKGAYYYPIVQRTSIRPQRTKNIQIKKRMFAPEQDPTKRQTDYVDMRIEEPDEDTKAARDVFRTMPYGEEDEAEGDGEAYGEQGRKDIQDSATPDRDDGR